MDELTLQRLRLGADRFIAAGGTERAKIQDLYGNGWDAVEDPGAVGREFRKMVVAGEIPGLRALDRKEWLNQRNHVEYVLIT
jgi:hypothetical protein